MYVNEFECVKFKFIELITQLKHHTDEGKGGIYGKTIVMKLSDWFSGLQTLLVFTEYTSVFYKDITKCKKDHDFITHPSRPTLGQNQGTQYLD